MIPEISQRVAWAVAHGPSPRGMLSLYRAVERAGSFADLPDWCRSWVEGVEARYGQNPNTAR